MPEDWTTYRKCQTCTESAASMRFTTWICRCGVNNNQRRWLSLPPSYVLLLVFFDSPLPCFLCSAEFAWNRKTDTVWQTVRQGLFIECHITCVNACFSDLVVINVSIFAFRMAFCAKNKQNLWIIQRNLKYFAFVWLFFSTFVTDSLMSLVD